MILERALIAALTVCATIGVWPLFDPAGRLVLVALWP
jgi:hypothetical protein